MDIEMPGMNGIDAARAIRLFDGPMSDIPIYALSAYDLKDGNLAGDGCFTGFIQKPLSLENVRTITG